MTVKKTLRGRVWVFGDHINTDLIMPGEAMYGKVPRDQIKHYAFKNHRPEFAEQVAAGDLITAGKNFGCGSSRPAARILKELGIRLLLAESFAQIFYRNAVNLGLPLLQCEGVSDLFNDGDVAEVDLVRGRVTNVDEGRSLQADPLPSFIWQLIEAGGILELLKRGQRLQREDWPDKKDLKERT